MTRIAVVLLFSSSMLYSQSKESLVGIIKTGSESILLKLEYDVDENGLLTGRSITDPFGPNRTITMVRGNQTDSTLTIRELDNIETKALSSKTFCYLQADDIKIITKKNEKRFRGIFTGLTSNGDTCAEGILILAQEASINQSVKTITEPAIKKTSNLEVRSRKKTIHKKLSTPSKPHVEVRKKRKRIKSKGPYLPVNDSENLKWPSDSITVYISDSFEEDGDSVLITQGNGHQDTIKLLSSKHIVYSGRAEELKNIKVSALNEGEMAPNTMIIFFIGESHWYRTETNLRKGEWTIITLNK